MTQEAGPNQTLNYPHLDRDLLNSRTMRNKFLPLKSYVIYGVLLLHPEWTKILVI